MPMGKVFSVRLGKAASTCLWLALCPALHAASIQVGAHDVRHDVRMTVGPEGRKVIFNESSDQRARRFSTSLVPVPALAGVDLDPLIVRHSDAQSLDPRLVRALIQVESGYNSHARSNKGAMGLMQLMPDTAVELAVSDPYDPDQNLRGGTAYLRQMLDHFGDLALAVAAYNAGAGAVERYRGVPPYGETLDYVQRVLGLYRGSGGAVGAGARTAYVPGHRPKPYVYRNGDGRLVLTTSLAN